MRQSAVSLYHRLFFFGIDILFAVYAIQIVQRDAERLIELGNNAEIGACSSVLPVADGIRGHADFFGNFLLILSFSLPVVLYTAADSVSIFTMVGIGDMKGIDVSTHNGNIDWNKVKADGIDFAILRAGFGRLEKQKDEKFEQNYAGAKAARIPVGAYWYSYAMDEDETRLEADVFLRCRQR